VRLIAKEGKRAIIRNKEYVERGKNTSVASAIKGSIV
jgi:hypothetical protein